MSPIYVTYLNLNLCHLFFYDLLSLFGALSLNVAKEGIKKMVKMVWNAITPEYLQMLKSQQLDN